MLLLVDSVAEKRKAQMELLRSLRTALTRQGTYRIGFRVGSGKKNPDMPIYSNGKGKIWFCSRHLRENVIVPRYWNAFGIFDPDRTVQAISVELNIPTDTNAEHVAGYFAKDSETGSSISCIVAKSAAAERA
jgi:hypothetical protein